MKPILLIACGNRLRGDDGLGWVLADRLAPVLQEAAIIRTQQLTPELAEPASLARLLVVVDASYVGRPGSWRVEAVVASGGQFTRARLGHQFTPECLLAYTAALYQSVPRMLLVSMTGGAFGFGERLTESVEAGLPELIEFMRELVKIAEE